MEFRLHKNIIKAVNVYSLNNGQQGFGDYLRGCFCMIHILRKKGIPFDMDISRHAMQQWIKPTTRYPCKKITQINPKMSNLPIRLNYIEANLKRATGIYTFFCNEYPVAPITQEDKQFIRNKILPTDEMKEYVQQTKDKWGITGPYKIIHLRCGDSSLKGELPDYDLFLNKIHPFSKDSIPYVILSDSVHMKERLHELYPHFIISMDVPVHTHGCCNAEKIKDTMRDFFLFTTASHVYAFTYYGHGTGFSEWPCRLYDIPYQCTCVKQ